MSKKTRRKSRKPASGRAKAKTAAGKVSKSKSKSSKKTAKKTSKKAAKASKRGASKAARASGKPSAKTARSAKAPKAIVTPVRKVASLMEGDAAPAFFLPRDGGQSVALANFAGRKLAVFFYPRADTPGCTREAMDFSRLSNAFATSQTAVLGVSADPVKTQEAFRDKHKLSVPLVSDEKHEMLKAYGAWGEKSMYGKMFTGILRTTVLIEAHGKIARIWRNVRVDGHADEVLAAARSL